MIFDELPIEQCEGSYLAHSLRAGEAVFRKGHLLSSQDIQHLAGAGIERLTVAKLEAGDINENEAATKLGSAFTSDNLRAEPAFTGRVNLFAERAGVVSIDKPLIDAINDIDESITVATLSDLAPVGADQMVATIKIIPFAVRRALLDRCLALTCERPALRLAPYRPRPVALIQTELPMLKASAYQKAIDITNRRLEPMKCAPVTDCRARHEVGHLQEAISRSIGAGAQMILIMGASAITDRRDVIPAAITAAGGQVLQFGMPVDPGNLILLAELEGKPVIGLPGCARSPKLNGFDWVLQRLLADLPVTAQDIRHMGVGGLLAEIPTRPQPREGGQAPARKPRISGLVMAAGRSSRMGDNKLLLDDHGQPIIARVVDHALAAGLDEVIVVCGHQIATIRTALAGRSVRIVEAEDYTLGMSASLKSGLRALSPKTDAVLVLLGDMPRIGTDLLKRLIAAYNPVEGRTIVLPVHDGKRGNPVLWDKRHFAEMMALSGDVGARHLIGEHADEVAEIPVDDPGIFLDIDTPEAYQRLQQD